MSRDAKTTPQQARCRQIGCQHPAHAAEIGVRVDDRGITVLPA